MSVPVFLIILHIVLYIILLSRSSMTHRWFILFFLILTVPTYMSFLPTVPAFNPLDLLCSVYLIPISETPTSRMVSLHMCFLSWRGKPMRHLNPRPKVLFIHSKCYRPPVKYQVDLSRFLILNDLVSTHRRKCQ